MNTRGVKLKDAHTEKGIKTLSLMETEPTDWGLTPIRWVWEYRLRPVKEICPSCHGHGSANIYPDGSLFDQRTDKEFKKIKNPGHFETQDFKKKHKIQYGRCPTCPQAYYNRGGERRPCSVGTGKVIVEKKIKVLVGYPEWAKKTKFDSRFHDIYRGHTASGKSVHSVCGLCSKSITGRWSGLVPVNGKGKNGVIHGMWVGADCAKKFFGIELVLDADQFKNLKKSEKKNYIIHRETK